MRYVGRATDDSYWEAKQEQDGRDYFGKDELYRDDLWDSAKYGECKGAYK